MDEGDLQLRVRPGTQPEEQQVIKGKESRYWGKVCQVEGAYVSGSGVHPVGLTERQRELLEEFQEIEEEGDRQVLLWLEVLQN